MTYKNTILYTVIFIILVLIIYILNLRSFGKLPDGNRKLRIKSLPNFNKNALNNLSKTDVKPSNVSYFELIKHVLLTKHPDKIPSNKLPSKSPNFNLGIPSVTWFGHSSYLLQLKGMSILVDPVFGDRISPFKYLGTKPFPGSNFFNLDNLPPLDVIIITHDHYDHLDYYTIKRLRNKNVVFITSIGVGQHLEYWGISPNKIIELSWGEKYKLPGGFEFIADSSRHFTGRKFLRNQTLWSAFILKSPTGNFYLGGDSGYDNHFKETGKLYGPFEMVFLECGQYNNYWPDIHMFPEQTVTAAKDLNAKILFPVHWGKFALSTHRWSEPAQRVMAAAKKCDLNIVIPYLGETISIDNGYNNENWWDR